MIIRTKKTSNFTTVSNSAILDPQLSFRAKGVWLYLMSKPNDWKANVKDIINFGKEGRDAVYTAIDELISGGYAEYIERERVGGQFQGRDLTVYETAINRGSPRTEKPYTVNPRLVNPPILKTERIKTEYNKTTLKRFEPKVLELSKDLAKGINENFEWINPTEKEISKWAEDIDKLHRLDGFEYLLIERVIKWSLEDEFWRQNIRSGAKLRKQFPTLLVRIKSEKKKIEVIS